MKPINPNRSSAVCLTPRQRIEHFCEAVTKTRNAFQSLRFFQRHPAQSRRTSEGETGQQEGLLAVHELQATSRSARSLINADLREALEPKMPDAMDQAIGWRRDLAAMEGLIAKRWDQDETLRSADDLETRVWSWSQDLIARAELMAKEPAVPQQQHSDGGAPPHQVESVAAEDLPEWSLCMPKGVLAEFILRCDLRDLESLYGSIIERKGPRAWRLRLDKCDAATVKRYETWQSKEPIKKKPRGKSAARRSAAQT